MALLKVDWYEKLSHLLERGYTPVVNESFIWANSKDDHRVVYYVSHEGKFVTINYYGNELVLESQDVYKLKTDFK